MSAGNAAGLRQTIWCTMYDVLWAGFGFRGLGFWVWASKRRSGMVVYGRYPVCFALL